MPAQPPSDDPQLPKLRRFRLADDGSGVAREVPDELHDEPRTDDRLHADQTGPQDMSVSEPTLPTSASSTPPPPVSATVTAGSPDTGPSARANPHHSTGPSTRPTIAAPLQAEPQSQKRSPLPVAIGAIAAAAVLGLVLWLVLRPGDDQAQKAGEESTVASSPSQMGITQWADGVCTVMTRFETTSMPLRAEAAKAAATAPAADQIAELQREASSALSTLADDVAAVGIPSSDKDAATTHTAVVASISESVESATAQGGVGSLRDRAVSISGSLDAPVSTFKKRLAELPEEPSGEVAQAQSCAAYL